MFGKTILFEQWLYYRQTFYKLIQVYAIPRDHAETHLKYSETQLWTFTILILGLVNTSIVWTTLEYRPLSCSALKAAIAK